MSKRVLPAHCYAMLKLAQQSLLAKYPQSEHRKVKHLFNVERHTLESSARANPEISAEFWVRLCERQIRSVRAQVASLLRGHTAIERARPLHLLRHRDQPWVDYHGTRMRRAAIKAVWHGLPDYAFAILRKKRIRWLVPDKETLGYAHWIKPGTECDLIYLAPELEKMSLAEVKEIVAHELAHVYHGHAHEKKPMWSLDPHEREAKMRVAQWGFAQKEAWQ